MSSPLPTSARPVLVALGAEARALRLIQAARRAARECAAPWIAVHVARPGDPQEDAAQAQVWLQEARRLGAETRCVEATTVAQGLAETARATRAQVLLVARARDRWPWARLGHSTAAELARRGLDLRLEVLEDAAPEGGAPKVDASSVLGAFLVLAACAAFAALLPGRRSLEWAVPPFLLGVAVITHRWGQALGTLASLVSVLYLNLLLETPAFRGEGRAWPGLLLFMAQLAGVQAATGLVHRLRRQAREVHGREVETASLYLLGGGLARARSLEEIAGTTAEHVRRLFKAEAWLLLPEGATWSAHPPLGPGEAPVPGDFLARLDPQEGGPPLPVDGAYHLALAGMEGPQGVLRIRPGADLPPASWELLQAFAVQVASALDRLRWLERAQAARLEQASERLRNELLAAIGHDLRTPLAAIHGAAGTLMLPDALPEGARRDLLAMIRDESARLADFLTNLLELARLEAAPSLVREWQPFEEVVGSALARLERSSGPLEISLHLPEDPILVPMDAVLVEQLLINLLANARRHAGAGIDLSARATPGRFEFEVGDRGPGLPEGQAHRVFDKFVRLPGAGEGGVGLGLAICRAIVRAHGGEIAAENRPGGGLVIRVGLPLAGDAPAGPP